MSPAIMIFRKNGRDLPHTVFLGCTEAEDLKSPGVDHQGPIPPHETVESSLVFYEIFTRVKVQMIGIGNDDLCPDIGKIFP